jgi:hypothetical protein
MICRFYLHLRHTSLYEDPWDFRGVEEREGRGGHVVIFNPHKHGTEYGFKICKAETYNNTKARTQSLSLFTLFWVVGCCGSMGKGLGRVAGCGPWLEPIFLPFRLFFWSSQGGMWSVKGDVGGCRVRTSETEVYVED